MATVMTEQQQLLKQQKQRVKFTSADKQRPLE
jgi:hypothetical protein